MIVGEAPGFEEDRTGRPFVGRAGRLLTELLTDAGLDRSRIFISNTIRCVPPKTHGSAKPSADAIQACLPFLRREIELVNAPIIVLAGATPLGALIDPTLKITRTRGQVFFKDGRWLYPVYHPSYVLRSGGGARDAATPATGTGRDDPRVLAEMVTDLANLAHLRSVHAATLRQPWPLQTILPALWTHRDVPHVPNQWSTVDVWHVHEHVAFPIVSGDAVTWDLRGLRHMFKTPSAIQELLNRWIGRPVRLTSVTERGGAVATILDRAEAHPSATTHPTPA